MQQIEITLIMCHHSPHRQREKKENEVEFPECKKPQNMSRLYEKPKDCMWPHAYYLSGQMKCPISHRDKMKELPTACSSIS